MSVDQDKDVLAGEYVLGTLDSFARAEAQALLSLDPAFAAAVQAWERRLGELGALIPVRDPPQEIWDKIKGQVSAEAAARRAAQPAAAAVQPAPRVEPARPIPPPASAKADTGPVAGAAPLPPQPEQPIPAGPADAMPAVPEGFIVEEPPAVDAAPVEAPRAPLPNAEIVQLRERVSRWRTATAGITALAASLFALVVLREIKPEIFPAELQPKVIEKVVEVEKIRTVEVPVPGPVPAEFVAVLQKDDSSPAFLLTFDIARRTVTARRVGAEREHGKSYELWLVSDQFPAPRSLGVIGAEPFTVRPIGGDYDAVTINRATYAVSLEPEGGSPTGVATGPVLYTGKLVQATPPGMVSTP